MTAIDHHRTRPATPVRASAPTGPAAGSAADQDTTRFPLLAFIVWTQLAAVAVVALAVGSVLAARHRPVVGVLLIAVALVILGLVIRFGPTCPAPGQCASEPAADPEVAA